MMLCFDDLRPSNQPEDGTVYFRYDDCRSGAVVLSTYRKVKDTPCGAWIELWDDGERKWVSHQANKTFAWRTKKQAFDHYHHRKRWQVKILHRQLEHAKMALANALRMKRDGLPDEFYYQPGEPAKWDMETVETHVVRGG